MFILFFAKIIKIKTEVFVGLYPIHFDLYQKECESEIRYKSTISINEKRIIFVTMKRTLLLIWTTVLFCGVTLSARPINSPNGKIELEVKGGEYHILYEGKTVLCITTTGISSPQAQAVRPRFAKKIITDYQMVAGKRLHCKNRGREYKAKIGKGVQFVVRLYDDGIAFRYEMKGLANAQPPQEQTAYRIAEGTRRWMQRWTDAYEGFFPISTTGTSRDHHWGYPALIEPTEGVFTLLTEANIERRNSASSLWNDNAVDTFRVVADKNDLVLNGDWHTPWRVAIIGHLSDVVASTLVTDLSAPCQVTDTSWIHPGTVAWVYWAYNHGSNDYDIIKKYVDMAAKLHLPYVLIDAEWDEMKNGKNVEDAVAYAKSQGVRPMIWYNSSVGWVNGAPGPKYRLNKPEDREREFAWCERIGVTGVKIDFFSGDTQMNMEYCIDLLECAARHHLTVNFHGATIPRGWQRTYPHLLTTEGVYGAEWYNNVPTFTDKAAGHNATLPFTRNVIGPMDYTPCAFSDSQHPHITTHAHELALTVLFESGLQHLADRPESFLAQPEAVQEFLGHLPVIWDETRLVSGYPGEHVILARRSGDTWYIAGINGTNEEKSMAVDLRFLGNKQHDVTSFTDSGDISHPWNIQTSHTLPEIITCQPRGGFVWIVK